MKTRRKRNAVTALLLALTLLSGVIFCAFSAYAEENEDLSALGAETYYFWGQNNNGPDFDAMKTPTGTFSYDASFGYYYYDIESFSSGDYCFVISTVSNSGASAASNQAVTAAAASGSYYLQHSNYSKYVCFHIWNDAKVPVRIYFVSPSAGCYAIPKSSVSATTAPSETSPAATSAPASASVSPTSSVSPTTSDSSSKTVVYCENAAGWDVVYVYLWNGNGAVQNAAWPGEMMTNIGGNIWRYESDVSYDNIIFNNRSTQTTDMVFPGSGYVFNNQSKTWEIYDTSPLSVLSYTTDLASPQYAGVEIILSASASGEGEVYYRFSATNNATNAVTLLSDFSKKSTAAWTPATAGTYTLTFSFKDEAGNSNERTLSYTVESGVTSTSPYIMKVTPSSGQIQKGESCAVSVFAGGGITGTNLLFYKLTVKDPSGSVVNVPYYARTSSFSFTPEKTGTYTLTVSVQASDNSEAVRFVTLSSVEEISDEPETQKPTTDNTDVLTLIGDADKNGKVEIVDATMIQRWCALLVTDDQINLKNADADRNKKVEVVDATTIQRYLALLIPEL